jgi:energy-converting hydrogenase Eha subunit E
VYKYNKIQCKTSKPTIVTGWISSPLCHLHGAEAKAKNKELKMVENISFIFLGLCNVKFHLVPFIAVHVFTCNILYKRNPWMSVTAAG